MRQLFLRGSYLADRRSFEMRQVPIVGGHYYSLKHGPVTSEVLELINDGTPQGESPWEKLISDRANHKVATAAEINSYDALARRLFLLRGGLRFRVRYPARGGCGRQRRRGLD
ncbi:MAG: Panacea domain-containing protein [Spartobacteria bacterium]